MISFIKIRSYISLSILLLIMGIVQAQNPGNNTKSQMIDVNEVGKENVNRGYSDTVIAKKELENVVVIGYGRVKKEDATGSLTAITVDPKSKLNATSPQELLMGKVAGVQITTSGGRPGDGATIRIRGGSSLNASNDPLIIIDGVPIDNGIINGMTNPLSAINPNDIESFTVLKDASATAIYGSRASNGVILITTKKGSDKKLSLSYNANVSVGTYTKLLPVMNGGEFRQMVQQYAPNGTNLLGMSNTNWQKAIYQPAVGTDHNISTMGTYKTEKAGKITLPYRVSFGYTYQNGIIKTSNMERGTIDVSLAPTFFDKHLTININAKGMIVNNRFADPATVGGAAQYDPTQSIYSNKGPVQAGQGSYNGYSSWFLNGIPNNNSTLNPLSLLNEKDDRSTAYRSIGNAQIEYKVHHFEDLRAVLNLGYDVTSSKGHTNYPEGSNLMWYQGSTGFVRGMGSRNDYNQFKKNNVLDFYLNYNKDAKNIYSKIDVTLGYSWQHFYQSGNAISRGLNKDTMYAETPYATENYLVSFFGRINWNLMNKYLFTVTAREDGSSRFAKGNQFGFFPAAAFAWRISEEKFMQDSKQVLSDLKLRLGWGITGQQDVGNIGNLPNDYPSQPIYNTSLPGSGALYPFIINGQVVWLPVTKPLAYDAKLKWESTTTYNVGLDYGFLQNRITGSIEYYYRNTTNLLNTVAVPAGTNLAAQVLTNVGSLYNQGVEFNINATAINTAKVRWDIGFNITYNETKITKLNLVNDNSPGSLVGGVSGGTGTTVQILSVGYAPYAFWVNEQVYDKDGKPEEGVYVDRNNDGKVDANDLYHYKQPTPKVYLGLTSRLTFYNFDFSFALRANFGNYVYNNVASQGYTTAIYNSGQSYLQNQSKDLLNTRFANPQLLSDYFVENASFLRMDNINLGYTFNNVANTRIGIRVYAMVQNVFVITKYKGVDPEIYGGIDNNFYPRPRTYTVGVNFNF